MEITRNTNVPALIPTDDADSDRLIRPLTGLNQAGVFPSGPKRVSECRYSGHGLGPGAIQQAHQPNEFVEISQITECITFLGKLIDWAEAEAERGGRRTALGETLLFSEQTYATGSRARAELRRRDLAALLVFAQESHYWLFGYDGGGYVFFQCAVLTADDGPTTLLCRRPDVAQARDTSTIEDIRVWLNAANQDPAGDLVRILAENGLGGARIGIETDSYGLTGFNFAAVQQAAGKVDLVEASDIVRSLRLRKSPEELAVVRRPPVWRMPPSSPSPSGPAGILDSTLTAAAMAAMLEGGGDMPPAGPLVNSGSRAVYGRGSAAPEASQRAIR